MAVKVVNDHACQELSVLAVLGCPFLYAISILSLSTPSGIPRIAMFVYLVMSHGHCFEVFVFQRVFLFLTCFYLLFWIFFLPQACWGFPLYFLYGTEFFIPDTFIYLWSLNLPAKMLICILSEFIYIKNLFLFAWVTLEPSFPIQGFRQ